MIVRSFWFAGLVVGAIAGGGVAPTCALTFTFEQIGTDTLTPGQASAFAAAAAAWSAALTDPVDVRVQIGFRDLGSSASGGMILGATSPNFRLASYAGWTSRLAADATTALDAVAVAHVPGSVPGGSVLVTSAEARAAGLAAVVPSDGSIEFTSNTAVTFATTRAALTAGAYDLIGVAQHEIGHLLGFVSSLDFGLTSRSALDLFRYSAVGTPSFTVGQAAYLSVDGGASIIGPLSPGGQLQASHWRSGTGGLLDPTVTAGVVQTITERDILALDAIGWDAAVPEPASGLVALAGLGVLTAYRGRRGVVLGGAQRRDA